MMYFDELIMNAFVVYHDEFDEVKMFSILEMWWVVYDYKCEECVALMMCYVCCWIFMKIMIEEYVDFDVA